MSVLNENTLIGASAASSGYEIDNSLRFDDGSSAYLSRTPSVTGNRKTWTFSTWMKTSSISNSTIFSTSQSYDVIRFNTASQLIVYFGVNLAYIAPAMKLRDPSAWYHICVAVDTTQATESDRIKVYVNGVVQTALVNTNYPSLNYDTGFNSTSYSNAIGRRQATSSLYFDGYLSEVNFIDGQALTPDSFGETGDYGEWLPKAYAGARGTNGFYLDFKDSGSLGNDAAGSNNWTPTNLAATDQMLDSPTNNFAVMNPIDTFGTITHSEGNLVVAGANDVDAHGTISMGDGKFYWECVPLVGPYAMLGLSEAGNTGYNHNIATTGVAYYQFNGNFYAQDSGTAYGSSYAVGDIIGVAYDGSAHTLTFYKNNVSQGTRTVLSLDYTPSIDGASNFTVAANFGQDSSFAGNKTAQGNQDANGIGDFYYAPPTGFLALCTKNLPDATVVPSEHFNTVLWAGNGVDDRSIEVGFQPDLTWTKCRTNTYSNLLHDSVRGATNELRSNWTGAEYVQANGLQAFESTGFQIGSVVDFNGAGETYAAWNWKAGGTGVSNTDGTITSTVSANVDAGFSIVSYTGIGGSATVGHGLSVKPEMVITKNRSSALHWLVWHKDQPSSSAVNASYQYLDTTAQSYTTSIYYNGSTMSSSVIGINYGEWAINYSGQNYISYAFHSVDGYSKVGSYTGNGSTDGTFVYTGFRPAYVMVKPTSRTGRWRIKDAARDIDNVMDKRLAAEGSDAEATGATEYIDFTSNGFKIRSSEGQWNGNGETNIYIAFAEQPFKHSNAR